MDNQAEVKILDQYSEESFQQLKAVLAELSPNTVISSESVKAIIASDSADILVALVDGVIVGTANINLIRRASQDRIWLDEFVVSSSQRGKGIAQTLWLEILEWGRARNAIALEFTSSPRKEAAQKFYAKMGATIRETNCFHVDLTNK